MTHRFKLAFTLIELLVVMAIMVILMAVSAPAIKSLSKGNNQAQAANVVRAFLANARSIAISQHRQAGVVFFEETNANSAPVHKNQTAMQILVEDYDQSTNTYPNLKSGNTVFIKNSSDRAYLPAGTQLAMMNDDTTTLFMTQENGTNTSARCRVILFDSSGQMILRNGICRQNLSGSAGTYPQAYGDWHIPTQGTTTPSLGVSSPGIIIFDRGEYLGENFVSDTARFAWLQNHGTLIIINAYTGNVIR